MAAWSCSRRRPRGPALPVLALTLAGLTGCASMGVTLTAGAPPSDPPPGVIVTDRIDRLDLSDGEVLTILLLGADEGDLDGQLGRADAFHLATLSPDRADATLISIPRDAWVAVPGRGTTKINACLVDGPEVCVRTVEDHFGIEVDHHVVTTVDAFETALDQLGGVAVEVEQSLAVSPEAALEVGRQRLDGAGALVYARDRSHRVDGDLGRSRAQGELLAALHAELAAAPGPGAIVRAAATLRAHTVTDLADLELLRLGREVARLDPARITLAQTSGVVRMEGRASIVELDETAVPLVRDAAADGVLER